MLTRGAGYVDTGIEFEKTRDRERQLRNLARKAKALGFDLAPRSVS